MNKNTKIVVGVIIVIIIIWGIWYATIRQPKKEGVIKVGVITSLSGDISAYGEGMKNSILLAFDDSGAKDKIELVIEDDKSCNTPEDVTIAQKFINIDKVKAIIGPMCSSATLSILPITEQNKIILITPMATSKALTSSGRFVFRTIASDAEKSTVIVKLAYNKGYRKTALIYDVANDSFIQEREDAKEVFTKLGGQVVIEESFKTKDTDFRTQLTKIKNSDADVVLMGGFPKEIGLILKQAKELGIDLQFMSTEASVGGKDLIDVGGTATEGLLFPFSETPTNKENQDFINAYRNRYGKEPPTYGSYESYDAAMILFKALMMMNRTAENIRSNLLRIGQNYYGASGVITFDENGDVQKPMIIKTVKNGQFVPYEE